ncbi:MAG TPA: T9SS type A sorting domain-containing protein, partial [Flavobacteriales bacterium]|nr:T9SS type A sorting domain-containing protein [Flavobacteriales bacterium]
GSLPEFSCGVTRQFPSSNKVWAWARSGANRYQFEFALPAENYVKLKSSTTNWIALNWAVDPLLDGRTYDVRVRISKDGGATWCVWGDPCSVTINNGGGINGGGQNVLLDGTDEVAAEPGMQMFPNPNRGDQVYVKLNGLEKAGQVQVDLYSLVGDRVVTTAYSVSDGTSTNAIELPGSMTTGMYVMRVTAGGKTWTERLVIER